VCRGCSWPTHSLLRRHICGTSWRCHNPHPPWLQPIMRVLLFGHWGGCWAPETAEWQPLRAFSSPISKVNMGDINILLLSVYPKGEYQSFEIIPTFRMDQPLPFCVKVFSSIERVCWQIVSLLMLHTLFNVAMVCFMIMPLSLGRKYLKLSVCVSRWGSNFCNFMRRRLSTCLSCAPHSCP
jgi:hypothetical protein